MAISDVNIAYITITIAINRIVILIIIFYWSKQFFKY